MGNIFSGSEVVELGIQIEKNGRDFYNTLIAQSKNQAAIDIFKFLAEQEAKHIAIFQGLLASVAKYEPAEAYPGEYISYMNTLASEYVFTQKDKGSQIAKRIKSDKEAVEKGIQFEKDSIIFYEGIKDAVPVDDQKVVDELIMEEQRHLMQLSELRKSIK